MKNNEGYKAVSRAMTAITIVSILLIVLSFLALMNVGEDTAINLLLCSIGGFIVRAILKGFRSVVEASELYLDRHQFTE